MRAWIFRVVKKYEKKIEFHLNIKQNINLTFGIQT